MDHANETEFRPIADRLVGDHMGLEVEVMARIRSAMNPDGRCSPSKMLPTAGACGMEHIERSHPGKQAHA